MMAQTRMHPEGFKARRFPRYRTLIEVTVDGCPSSGRFSITELSRAGCLIYPPLPPLESREIDLSFRLGEDLPAVRCKGEVIYSLEGRGTGVAFTEVSVPSQGLITSYCESQLASGRQNSE